MFGLCFSIYIVMCVYRYSTSVLFRIMVCTVVVVVFESCFFFFKQKTAYEMRISDWSSDVCSSDDLFATLQSTFSSFYINDFNRNGRVYRVQMQADADYRAFAEGLRNVYVRSRDGKPIPVTALAQVSKTNGPDLVERYNVFQATRVLGAHTPGYSYDQALEALEELASEH